MSLRLNCKLLCKRISEDELEKCINVLEDERKRRKLIRDDEIIIKGGNDGNA